MRSRKWSRCMNDIPKINVGAHAGQLSLTPDFTEPDDFAFCGAPTNVLNAMPPYTLPDYLQSWMKPDFLNAMININCKYASRLRPSSFEKPYADVVIDTIRQYYGNSLDEVAQIVDWQEVYSSDRGSRSSGSWFTSLVSSVFFIQSIMLKRTLRVLQSSGG